jgi:hypothetical protein
LVGRAEIEPAFFADVEQADLPLRNLDFGLAVRGEIGAFAEPAKPVILMRFGQPAFPGSRSRGVLLSGFLCSELSLLVLFWFS